MSTKPPLIFDPKAVWLHRARATRTIADAVLLHEVAVGLKERLSAVRRSFHRGYMLDTSQGVMSMLEAAASRWTFATSNEREALSPTSADHDLVVSALTLQSVNDLPGMLVQLRGVLTPDGLFMAALFGGETLTELRQSLAAAEIEVTGGMSPRVGPFADVRDLGGLLQRAGFALPVSDVERTVVRYSDLMRLVRDLRALGQTNALAARNRKPLSRAILRATNQVYAERFGDPDGKLRATFDIVYLTGWAPHSSQQQPQKPGSATARLATALDTSEQSAGEKPRR